MGGKVVGDVARRVWEDGTAALYICGLRV